jgi:phospholipase/carboxylesterase
MTSRQPLLETLEHETGPNPGASIIWMHGLGADAHDFEPVVPMLALPGGPALRFVFPNAPVRPVTINGGVPMRAWYDIRAFDISAREDEAGIQASRVAIEDLMAREVARGIPHSKLLLGGFSQGAAMTLHTGLRYSEALAGLVVLSGYLPLAGRLKSEASAANHQTPIFMGHGELDQVVPVALARRSAAGLKEFGYAVTLKTYLMPHSVVDEELRDIRAFLATALR